MRVFESPKGIPVFTLPQDTNSSLSVNLVAAQGFEEQDEVDSGAQSLSWDYSGS